MADVLCIGNASFDLSVLSSGFPAENSKAETDTMLEAGGGPAANAAYLLASWGIACAFAGLVGDDHYGRRIAVEFRAAGVDISLLEQRPGHITPLSVILINRNNGSRTIVNRKSKTKPLKLEPEHLIRLSPRVLLFDGHELEASLDALNAFPNVTSILDAGSWREGTAELAGRVNYLAASERFALQACQLPDLDSLEHRRSALRQLRARYRNTVVVTLGERGLIADDGHGLFEMDAFKVKAVDTTAAGDIFHGAFVYGVLREMSFQQNLRHP
ncbi:MAG: PfkB family carbohydrate kinase, partial [Candidatus Omnitrophica bacterium]|nr:PfkB family carbohydrate kinase [Candidatus Omnitrophota bacterium]